MMMFLMMAFHPKSHAQSPQDWKLINTVKNVSIYYEQGTCSTAGVLFLKMINNNSQPVTVDWSLWDDGVFKKIQLAANETLTGACKNQLRLYTLIEFIPKNKSAGDIRPMIKVTDL